MADYPDSPSSQESSPEERAAPANGEKRKRSLQQVSTLQARKRVVTWMVEEVEKSGSDKHIPSKAVKKFPEQFRGNEKANLNKASRWFKRRETILALQEDEVIGITHRVIRRRTAIGQSSVPRRQVLVKCSKGRGRKQSQWSVELQRLLVSEFERLSSMGVKFSGPVLVALATRILKDADGEYDLQLDMARDERNDLIRKITKRWIQSFMERYSIVARRQCGKLMVSPVKQIQMEQEVAYHLGVVKREFDAGTLDEDVVENVDESHFLVNNGQWTHAVICGVQ